MQIQVVDSTSISVSRYSKLEILPSEILTSVYELLTDPDDRIMLALASMTLAAHCDYLTSIGVFSNPTTLGLHLLAARIDVWVRPDKGYCRLCRRVRPIDRKWWSAVSWYLKKDKRRLPGTYYCDETLT